MRISSSKIASTSAPAKEQVRFTTSSPDYVGPADGFSKSPSQQGIFRPISHALRSLAYRAEIEGEENLPTKGAHVYASNHSSFIDAALITPLTRQDTRVMATIDLFRNNVTAMLCDKMGVFPVDRLRPSRASIEHPKQVLREGKGFLIYPEGTFPDQCAEGQIGPFKRGVGAIAIDGKAEGIIPIAVDYRPNAGVPTSAKVKAYLLAASVTGAGLLSTMGGPLGRVLGGAVNGAITGARLAASVGYSSLENPHFWNPAPKLASGLLAGAAGAVLGGVAGAFVAQAGTGLALGLSVSAGLSTLGAANWWNERPVAKVVIGPKMPIQNFIDQAQQSSSQRRHAILGLTEQLHQTIGGMKAELSGVPYDPSANKIEKGFPPVTELKSKRFG